MPLYDRHDGLTRRDLLRIGGSGVLGLTLGALFRHQAQAGEAAGGGRSGWGQAKSIILCDHWPYCDIAVIAGGGTKRGHVHGRSDKTGSAPLDSPVHPSQLLASIFHACGIDPQTIVYNHLNQPRELVKAEAVTQLFA